MPTFELLFIMVSVTAVHYTKTTNCPTNSSKACTKLINIKVTNTRMFGMLCNICLMQINHVSIYCSLLEVVLTCIRC